MAVIYIEGFDKYGPLGLTSTGLQTAMQQEWTQVSGAVSLFIAAGLSSTGFALKLNGGGTPFLQKTLPNSYSTFYFGYRVNCVLSAASGGVGFMLGSTSAFAVWINSSGQIVVGNSLNGSVAATSTQSVTNNSTHYIECAVTLSTTGTGSCTVYLDGVATSISLTSHSWGAASMNAVQVGVSNNSNSSTYDDFYLFDGTGATNNACLLTNPRIETQFPNSDSAVAFTFGAGVLGLPYSYDSAAATNPGANQLMLRPFTPQAGCTVSSISILPGTTSSTANFMPCIYSDSAGAPHTLLSSGSQVTGCTAGTSLTMPLTTPQTLTGGTQYWIGYINNTSINLYESDTGTTGAHATNTYTSGAPSTAPTMTTGYSDLTIWGNLTGASSNYPQVDGTPPAGNLSYNFSSTVSQEDLYGFPVLSSSPNNIYTVRVSANCAKSDAGTRTANLRMKSGASESSGSSSGQTPAGSFTWLFSFFDTDPNTGSAWTASGLNSATRGVQVNS